MRSRRSAPPRPPASQEPARAVPHRPAQGCTAQDQRPPRPPPLAPAGPAPGAVAPAGPAGAPAPPPTRPPAPRPAPPGRPTTMRHPMGLTIGLDVGGTKVAAGVVDEHGKIVEKLKRPTPSADGERILEVIAAVVAELCGRHAVRAGGLGVAGWLDETRPVLRFSPHLPWREDATLIQRLQVLTGLPVTMDNDANASLWGEVRFGAAQG